MKTNNEKQSSIDVYTATDADVYRASKSSIPHARLEASLVKNLFAPTVRGKTVLDLGSGDGYYTELFVQSGATKVVGIDASPAMLQLARDSARQKSLPIEYFERDARDVDVLTEGGFDQIFVGWTLVHGITLPDLQAMTNSIGRNLKLGGEIFVITMPQYTRQTVQPGGPIELSGVHVGGILDGEESQWHDGDRAYFKFAGSDSQVWFTCWRTSTTIQCLSEAGIEAAPLDLHDGWKGVDLTLENPAVIEAARRSQLMTIIAGTKRDR